MRLYGRPMNHVSVNVTWVLGKNIRSLILGCSVPQMNSSKSVSNWESVLNRNWGWETLHSHWKLRKRQKVDIFINVYFTILVLWLSAGVTGNEFIENMEALLCELKLLIRTHIQRKKVIFFLLKQAFLGLKINQVRILIWFNVWKFISLWNIFNANKWTYWFKSQNLWYEQISLSNEPETVIS